MNKSVRVCCYRFAFAAASSAAFRRISPWLLVLGLGLGACSSGQPTLGSGTSDSANEKAHSCPVQTKTFLTVRIEGHQELVFASDALAALALDPNVQIDGLTLHLTLEKEPKTALAIDINGLQANNADGRNGITSVQGTSITVDLSRLVLNGAKPLLIFLNEILFHQGELRIGVHGADPRVAVASLDIMWHQAGVCGSPTPTPTPSPTPGSSPTPTPVPTPVPTPSPTPTPVPVAPHTTLTSISPSQTDTNISSISFSFAADQTGVSYVCQLDQGAASACSSPQTYSGLANGAHTFSVTATNAAGLMDANPPQYQWTVDTIAPTVTIQPPPSLTNQTSIVVPFTTSETGTAACSLDGANPTPCTSPFTASGLSEGTHAIGITEVDAAGNPSSPAIFTWTIDLTAPQTQIMQVSPAGSPTNQTTLNVLFGAGESATFECALDHGLFASCQSPLAFTALQEGAHWLDVRATDLAGNLGPVASYAWTVDLTPPTLQLGNVLPAAGSTSNATVISVEFSSSEPATISCSLDQAPAAACVSPYQASIATEGAHSLTITATDAAGNAATPLVVNWTMDYTGPALSFGLIQPSGASAVNSATMSFPIQTTEVTLLTATLDGVSLGSVTSPITLNALTEGDHVLAVSGADEAGNPSNTLTHSFTVDLTPPVASANLENSATITNSTSNAVDFTSNENGTFLCQLDGAGFSACVSPLTLTGLSEGSHQVDVKAVDLAGNQSAVVSVNWTIDLTAPQTSLSQKQTGSNTMVFTFTSSESGSTFQCALDGANAQSCTSPMTVANLTSGSHVFNVKATDPAGNQEIGGASASFTIQPPVTTSITGAQPAGSILNQTLLTISFTSSQSQATFICSLDGQAPQPCTSPFALSSLTDGSHLFKVQAVDAWGTVDATGATYAFTIDTVAPTVTLTPDSTQSPTNLTSRGFSFTASEPVKSFECQIDGGGFSVCTSPHSVTGLANGTHTFGVRATDVAGNVGQPATSTWTVDTGPPQTSAVLSQSSASSVSISLLSNETPSTFQCSLDNAALSSCTSPVIYSGLAPGSHTFVAKATDAAGNQDPTGAKVTFTAYAPITTTLVSQSPSGALVNQSSMTFTFSASQPNATFLCSLDQGAASACPSPMSYSGLADGAHQFRVQAVDAWGARDATGASAQWTVDTTPPKTTATLTQTGANAVSFALSATESGVTYQCALDGAALSSCTSPVVYSALAAGSHTFLAKATDAAGNQDPTGSSVSFTIQAPISTTITSQSPSGSTITQSSVSFSFTANQTGASFLCSMDGQSAQSCTSPVSYASLASGSHVFKVQAVDSWGNIDATGATATFTVNLCQYGAPVISGLAVTSISQTTAIVTWTTDVPSSSQVTYTNVGTLAQGQTALNTNLVTSHSVQVTGLSSNTVYSAVATSVACSNTTNSQSISFRTSR